MNADISVWTQSLVAVLIVSSVSLLGSLWLVIRPDLLQRTLLLLVSFAAGALLGDAFLHLIPESAEGPGGLEVTASAWLLGGILSFLVLEKVLHWHHAHLPHEEVIHPVAVSNLVGDALHNFLDGAIVAGAFVASPATGWATTIAVLLHEIPQELGDFGILVHSGVGPRRALALNFFSGLIALVGAVATLVLLPLESVEQLLVPFSAGAFVYIAGTDLIPELHKEPEPLKSLLQVVALVAGIGVMAILLVLE
ncbi:MAG TPA: ZIP family metal transporter [Actinomycetota bacterium]|nr:ZIP family metal transporter [Actinomycetota bacterium]